MLPYDLLESMVSTEKICCDSDGFAFTGDNASILPLFIFSFSFLSYNVRGVSFLVCLVFSVQSSKCLLKPESHLLPHIKDSGTVIFFNPVFAYPKVVF